MHTSLAVARYKKEIGVNFIERIFGIAPDGGSGAFELLLFLLPIMGLAIIGKRWYGRDSRLRDHHPRVGDDADR